MSLFSKDIKFKFLSLDELSISVDRLSRFKLPEEAYFRVFSSILQKSLITPKYSKKELEELPAEIISKLVKHIWNKSVENIFGKNEDRQISRRYGMLFKDGCKENNKIGRSDGQRKRCKIS